MKYDFWNASRMFPQTNLSSVILGTIRGLKNPSLEDEKKQAEKMYKDAMNQYIATRLGRPLEHMSVS